MRETRDSTPLKESGIQAGSLDIEHFFPLVQRAARIGANLALQDFALQKKAKQDRGSGDETFGKALRSTRERDGLTQQEFAEQAGVHYTTVGKIETGDRGMTVETFAKILHAGGSGMMNWAIRYFATGQTE